MTYRLLSSVSVQHSSRITTYYTLYTGNTKSSLNYPQHENNTTRVPLPQSQSITNDMLTNTTATVDHTIHTSHTTTTPQWKYDSKHDTIQSQYTKINLINSNNPHEQMKHNPRYPTLVNSYVFLTRTRWHQNKYNTLTNSKITQ